MPIVDNLLINSLLIASWVLKELRDAFKGGLLIKPSSLKMSSYKPQ